MSFWGRCFFPMKTAEVEVTNSLSWAQCLTCWLWQTTLWSEERERELPKWCSSRDHGWTTTTSLHWGHSRGGCKGWRVACREGPLLLLPLVLVFLLHVVVTATPVTSCNNHETNCRDNSSLTDIRKLYKSIRSSSFVKFKFMACFNMVNTINIITIDYNITSLSLS